MTGNGTFELPDGRSEKYTIFRAVERISPLEMYGKPWTVLTYQQQMDLIAFSDVRCREESRAPRTEQVRSPQRGG